MDPVHLHAQIRYFKHSISFTINSTFFEIDSLEEYGNRAQGKKKKLELGIKEGFGCRDDLAPLLLYHSRVFKGHRGGLNSNTVMDYMLEEVFSLPRFRYRTISRKRSPPRRRNLA